ncbi:hypothetical protein BELL_0175g00110 [Botrytis elliptica]|uniref:Uncharacterized protein n=1 Tax=Botrytis elliptica TaxID=278938 RepID=A0A4Z1JR57_9HELO|nr:hypothetical protein BELL_0175g00110 [Botrytis elliptica]
MTCSDLGFRQRSTPVRVVLQSLLLKQMSTYNVYVSYGCFQTNANPVDYGDIGKSVYQANDMNMMGTVLSEILSQDYAQNVMSMQREDWRGIGKVFIRRRKQCIDAYSGLEPSTVSAQIFFTSTRTEMIIFSATSQDFYDRTNFVIVPFRRPGRKY